MTSGGDSLATVLARIEVLQAALRQATGRADHARKLEIVNLRRSLALELGLVIDAAAREPKITANEDIAREFRSRFSTMRSSLALHQSQWPAVSLDEVTPAYHQSTKAVREASAEFLNWAKARLAR